MKRLSRIAGIGASVLGILFAAIAFSGCQTNEPTYGTFQGIPDSATNVVGTHANPGGPVEVFHTGDLVVVLLNSYNPDRKFDPFGERIKEDGIITPPEVGPIKAVNRTANDIQKEIQEKLDRKLKGVRVTVSAGDRFFFVDGEVTARGSRPFQSNMDIVQAITSAGGTTEFASSTVNVTHNNGKTDVIDLKKARRGDPKHNIMISPGDRIWVVRRWL